MVWSSRPLQVAVWVSAGLALTGVGWLLTPRPVPIYDGIGFPDEPYRYVAPPSYVRKTKPPGTAIGQLKATRGVSGFGVLASPEVGPQVQLYFNDGALSAPAAATAITVTATPHAQGAASGDAATLGNVYTVTATSDAGPVAFTAAASAEITLRTPAPANDKPVVVFRVDAADAWHDLPTQQVSEDRFQTALTRAGDYTIAAPPGWSTVAGGDAGNAARIAGAVRFIRVAVPLGGAVVVMALILLGVRLRTMRRRAAATRSGRSGQRR